MSPDRKRATAAFLVLTVGAVCAAAGGWMAWRTVQNRKVFDPSLSGAHRYDPAASEPGYNLFDGKLIDAAGRVVKEWSRISLGVIDSDGDYYAQTCVECPTWGRYTWDDQVVWEKHFAIHHEILLTPQDTIITFTKEVQEYQGRKVEFDVILELDKRGQILQRYSIWDHLKEFQAFHKSLELDLPPTFVIPEANRKDISVWGGNYDYYHLNSLSLVPPNALAGKHPAFNPGNWIICFRHGSMIFILDAPTKKILWRAIYDQVADQLEGPHTPQMLPSGNILIFDNGRYRQWSRLIELDPVTLKVVWEYRAKNFFTITQGGVQELPGGNMLVTQADDGRVFELTPDKKIVWEYYHQDCQNRANSTDEKQWGYRQQIYRMTRYPKEMIDRLLSKPAAKGS